MLEKNLRNIEFFKEKDLTYCFDSLSEVLNRETILTYVDYLVENKIPFNIGLIDVDNFKYINDNFGHMCGDVVIHEMAQLFLNKVIGKGIVGRYGGDEFVVVSENVTDYQDVWEEFHSINFAVGKLSIPDIRHMSLSVTTGISRYPLDGDTSDKVFACADKALYRGKSKGRNCFIIYLEDKHGAIELKTEKETVYSSMDLHAQIFNMLTKSNNIFDNVKTLFHYLSSYLMIDHFSIETPNGIYFKTIHPLCPESSFTHMDYDTLSSLLSNIGLFFGNRMDYLFENHKDLHAEMKRQKVKSILLCRIMVRDKEYGILRADMVGKSRVWQAQTMDLILTASRIIAMMLFYTDKKIEEL